MIATDTDRLRDAVRSQRRRTYRLVRRSAARTFARLRTQRLATGDWAAGPPDFIGVGVQRAGTSWWFSMIERHPDVHRLGAMKKELHHFDDGWTGGPLDVGAYHERFRRPPGRLCGEWTPRYMYDPWTPPLLRRAAPDAKLLVLLRDPVERFVSGVTHAAERGHAVDADVVVDAINRGRYAEQLERLFSHFPRSQVMVQQLEACRSTADAELRRTASFLGLDPDRLPPIEGERPRNRTKIEPVAVDPALLADLRTTYAPEVSRLTALVPDIDLGLWPSVAPH